MKAGDLVKVKRGDHWRQAKLLPLPENAVGRHVQILEPGMVGFEQVLVDNHLVKRYQPLEEDWQPTDQELMEVYTTAQKALFALLPGETIEVKDRSIVGYHGAVTLDPENVEQETIGAFIERKGWAVTVWKHESATRHHPEEIWDAPVGKYLNYGAAVQSFVETIFKLKSEDYWNAQADEAMAKEFQENGW